MVTWFPTYLEEMGGGSAPTYAAYSTLSKKFVLCISNQLSAFVTKLKTFQQIEIIAGAYWAIKITQFRKVQIWSKKIVIFYPLWRRPDRTLPLNYFQVHNILSLKSLLTKRMCEVFNRENIVFSRIVQKTVENVSSHCSSLLFARIELWDVRKISISIQGKISRHAYLCSELRPRNPNATQRRKRFVTHALTYLH